MSQKMKIACQNINVTNNRYENLKIIEIYVLNIPNTIIGTYLHAIYKQLCVGTLL